MKLFLSALCLCASGLLIYVSYKLIYAYTMIADDSQWRMRRVQSAAD